MVKFNIETFILKNHEDYDYHSMRDGKFPSAILNASKISPDILNRINENVNIYIENKGVPKFYYTNNLEERLTKVVVFIHEGFYYPEGTDKISDLIKEWNLYKNIISNYWTPISLKMFQDAYIDESTTSFQKYLRKFRVASSKSANKILFSSINSTYANSFSGLVYNTAVRKTDDKKFNVIIQPDIRNALAITTYFKILKFEEKRKSFFFGLDSAYRDVLEQIPSDLRTKQFDEFKIIEELLGPITKKILYNKRIRNF